MKYQQLGCAHSFKPRLALKDYTALFHGLGPKISEYIVVSGICVLCRYAIQNYKGRCDVAYAYVWQVTPQREAADEMNYDLISGFMHLLDSDEEKRHMEEHARKAFQHPAIYDIRQLIVHWVPKYLFVPTPVEANQQSLARACEEYYQGIGAEDTPSVKRTADFLWDVATRIGSAQAAEDIFFMGLAAVCRNITSCLIHRVNEANVAKLRNAELGRALDTYLSYERKAMGTYASYGRDNRNVLKSDKAMLNAVIHATECDNSNFFSCYRDRRIVPGGAKYDEGRFRLHYGIMRWELLNLLFVYIIDPRRTADDGGPKIGLGAIMEGLGGNADNYVSVRELIERMALGPSALYE